MLVLLSFDCSTSSFRLCSNPDHRIGKTLFDQLRPLNVRKHRKRMWAVCPTCKEGAHLFLFRVCFCCIVFAVFARSRFFAFCCLFASAPFMRFPVRALTLLFLMQVVMLPSASAVSKFT